MPEFTEVNDLTKSISRLSINKNSDLGVLTFTCILLPSKNQYIEYNAENDNTWMSIYTNLYVGPVTVSSRWVITKNKQSAKDIWRLSGSDMFSKRQF